jgi:hypothetical protein
MNANTAVTLIFQIIANLPAAVATGAEVIRLVNEAYQALSEAYTGRDPTPAEINTLVLRIVANSEAIQRVG